MDAIKGVNFRVVDGVFQIMVPYGHQWFIKRGNQPLKATSDTLEWYDVDVSGGDTGYQTFFWKTAPASDHDIDPRDPLTVTLWVDEDNQAWLEKPSVWKKIASVAVGAIILLALLIFGIKSLFSTGHRPSDVDSAAKDAAIQSLMQKVDMLLIENTRMSNLVAQKETLPAANPPVVSTNTPANNTKTNEVPAPVPSPTPTSSATNSPTNIMNNSGAVSLPISTNRSVQIDRNAGAISFGGNATVNVYGGSPTEVWATTKLVVLDNLRLSGLTNEITISLVAGDVLEIDQSTRRAGAWLVTPYENTLRLCNSQRCESDKWKEWLTTSTQTLGSSSKWRLRNEYFDGTARFQIVWLPN